MSFVKRCPLFKMSFIGGSTFWTVLVHSVLTLSLDPVILKPPPGRKKEKDKRKSSLQAAAAADIPRVPRSVEPKSRKSRRISSSSGTFNLCK